MEHARPPAELCLEGGPAARADAWRKWYRQFEVFLKASGVHKESKEVQASLLVNLIGSDGYDIYSTFRYDKDESQEDLSVLVQKFNEHFGTKKNTTFARYKFFTRQQEMGESIDEYVTALKLLSQQCEFKDLEESLIRDRIVCGVSDSTLRERMLRADELTLAQAVKMCQAGEISSEEKRQIEGTKTEQGAGAGAVDVLYETRGSRRFGAGPAAGGRRAPPPAGAPPRGSSAGAWGGASGGRAQQVGWGPGGAGGAPGLVRLCGACAGIRCDGVKCPARKVKCFWCGQIGHYKKMCPRKSEKKVFYIEESCDSDNNGEDLYYVSAIDGCTEDCGEDSNKWYEILILSMNGRKMNFKLDTGSDLNVMSLNNFNKLGIDRNNLKPDKTRAMSFCGNYIPIVGSCSIDWMYKDKMYNLRFVISEHDCQSVLGKYACEELGLISRIYTVDVDQYNDLFQGLGKLPGKYKIIVEQDAQPLVCPVRKIPIGVRDKLLTELERMENIGVIRKVSHPTPWVNGIVVAAKKDGSLRVCLDPRPLNRAVRRAHYPLPTLTEIASKLQGARFFSKLDARSGFWMVQLEESSADLCTFGTPFGRYQFLRLPYGINCASEVFHARIRQILEDLEGTDSFIDDIIVWGSTLEEHDARLERLLKRAREVGIKFNKEKCEFRVNQVTYLGHTFSAEGMRIDESKLKAVKEMPSPTDRQSLERFLGVVNFLSKFIPNYSEVASPLRCLLRKDVEWCWDEAQERAVQQLKELVCSAPVLALYAPREPVLLSVDASARALGAVLLQGGRPVEFASSTLTETQTRYAQIEKELLAIVFALERFHQYVYGRCDVTVETDHKPLVSLFEKPLNSVPARLQRMMLRIQGYDFKVTYTPGKYMYVADALSRAALPELVSEKVSEEITEQSCFLISNVRFSDSKQVLIKEWTGKNVECQLIIRYIQQGWPNNKFQVDERIRGLWSYRNSFEYVDGIIFKDNLVYIPSELRSEMIKRVHEDGHMGIDRCKRLAREVMFWPGMTSDVERAVRRCGACHMRAARPAREPMMTHYIPDMPWAKVGSDIFQCGKKYFLILVDYFSNFIEVCPLTSIGSKAVILAMKDQFARHGIPRELVSDNGPAYSSKEFQQFKNEWGFNHVTSSPNYAQSNGRSERSVRTMKDMLMKCMSSGSDFYLGLLNFRTTPRDGISSPSELLMGRKLNSRLPVHTDKLRPKYDCTKEYKNIISKQIHSKSNYDKNTKILKELKTGDKAVMTDDKKRKYVSVEQRAEEPRSYFVIDSSGARYRRNRRHLIKVDTITPKEETSAIAATVATDSVSTSIVEQSLQQQESGESSMEDSLSNWSSAESGDSSTGTDREADPTLSPIGVGDVTLTTNIDSPLSSSPRVNTGRLAAKQAREKIKEMMVNQ